jgi:prepilin-type N-terminal cleavage/methylation domain-containing protein
MRRHGNKAGFTLVEVIVVIVIIAILAAIGVPALTGYIDKAQDKQYIAQARNAMIAVRTVIGEAYADGEFANSETHGYDVGYLTTGHFDGKMVWYTEVLSYLISDPSSTDRYELLKRASSFLGEEALIEDGDYDKENGYWTANIFGSNGSTALNADGFSWFFYPEGDNPYKPVIIVTYKMDRVDTTDMEGNIYTAFSDSVFDSDNDIPYNPNAGYEVYHLANGS